MWTVFLIAGIPVVFTMAVWVVVTAIRILRPEKEQDLLSDRSYRMRVSVRAGKKVRVRFSDIRELERERAVEGGEELNTIYVRQEGESMGIPFDWYSDLDVRRN